MCEATAQYQRVLRYIEHCGAKGLNDIVALTIAQMPCGRLVPCACGIAQEAYSPLRTKGFDSSASYRSDRRLKLSADKHPDRGIAAEMEVARNG